MIIYMWIGILSQIPKLLPPSSTVVSTVVAMCGEQLTLNGYGVHTQENWSIHLTCFQGSKVHCHNFESNLER